MSVTRAGSVHHTFAPARAPSLPALKQIAQQGSFGNKEGWSVVNQGLALNSSREDAASAISFLKRACLAENSVTLQGKKVAIKDPENLDTAQWFERTLQPHALLETNKTGLKYSPNLEGGPAAAKTRHGKLVDAFIANKELRDLIFCVDSKPTDPRPKQQDIHRMMDDMRTINVGGEATKSATLSFKMLNTTVSVPVKAGESGEVVAKHLAAAINQARARVQADKLNGDVFFHEDDATVNGPCAVAVGNTVAVCGAVYD